MRATVFDLNPPLCAMRLLATEEAIVASSSPAPPLRGLGAHRDRCVAIFHGMSDDACKGAPAPARPHVCISARGAIGTHANADTCLRSRFAAIAQFTDAAVTTTIVDADAVVSAAAPPLPLLRPCRSDAGSWGCFRARHPGPRQRPQAADLNARRVFCCLGLRWGSVGGGGGSQKRICTHLYAFTCRPRFAPCGQRHLLKPPKSVPCARIG